MDFFDEIKASLKDVDASNVKAYFDEKTNEIKTDFEDLLTEEVPGIAKQKADELRNKTEHLVDEAVANGVPALEEASRKLLEKVVVTSKYIIEKLETK